MVRRFKIDKLVRDHVPAQAAAAGVGMCVRVMGDEEYAARLKEKLLEESHEVARAQTEQELCEELGDVLEVIQAIAQFQNIPWHDLVACAEQKRKNKGGFKSRLYAAYVDVDKENPQLQYYLTRSHLYPEML